MIRIFAVLAALVCAAPAFAQPLPANLDKANAVVIDTTKGRVVIKLRTDLAPQHAERIKQLAREGYYNNVPFHRVMDGFMAQTGDGQNFNGTGGSKYPNLKAEFSNVPYKRGIVGMARKGGNNDSANSQFFIMFADGSGLNGQYTVIGEVLSGMDVVDKLAKGEPPASPDRMVRVQVAADLLDVRLKRRSWRGSHRLERYSQPLALFQWVRTSSPRGGTTAQRAVPKWGRPFVYLDTFPR